MDDTTQPIDISEVDLSGAEPKRASDSSRPSAFGSENATMTLSPAEPGSNVAVFGLGPVGLCAVQGARIMGAAQIIGVDPVKARRDLALKVGATAVLDPNVDQGWALVTKIKNMCKGPTDRYFAGGRYPVANRAGVAANIGPDHVIEAVGFDRFPPKVEAGPDPTGIQPLQQM